MIWEGTKKYKKHVPNLDFPGTRTEAVRIGLYDGIMGYNHHVFSVI